MKKILYLVTQSEWGGAQQYVFDLASHLSKDEFAVHVAAGGDGELFDRCRAAGLSAHLVENLVRPINPFLDFFAYLEIKKLIKKIKPDIIHLNSSKCGLLGSLAAKVCGVKRSVYTAHGFVFNEPRGYLTTALYKRVERSNSKRLNKIIAVSEFDRQSGIKAGIDPDKLTTIHNGLDPKTAQFLPKDNALTVLEAVISEKVGRTKLKSPLVGCIANFYPAKGLDVLIPAMARVKGTLVVIGEGYLRPHLEGLIKKHKLRNCVFLTGYLENASQYLTAFDLFVLPSRKEGLPYVLLEAGMAKIPVVATEVGGIPEIVHNKINGYLAKPGNVLDLANTINIALAKPLPFHLDNDFRLEKMLDETLRVYRG